MTENLHDLYAAVDRLKPEEMEDLRDYLDQRLTQPQIKDETAQEKIAAIRQAFAEIREGLTQEELDDMIWAMNVEYIEPLNPSDYDSQDEDEDNDG